MLYRLRTVVVKVVIFCCFFFFKQKTAYEMRISDWSSDVCSSDLFTSWKKLDNLASGAIAVPSDKPVKTAAFTSGYGVRSDPFRGGAAMHAGDRKSVV